MLGKSLRHSKISKPLMADASTSKFDVTLLSSGHNVADARLHRLVGALMRLGLRVEVIAQGVASDAPVGSAFKQALGGKDLQSRVLRAMKLPWQAQGRVLIAIDPDLIPISILAARLRRRRIVVDVHEDYLSLLRDRSWAKGPIGIGARAVAILASALARRADLTIVADVQVPPLSAKNRLVVRNLPDLRIPFTDQIDATPRAIYVGDVRASRGLGAMLSTIEETQRGGAPWRLDVVGPVAPADQEFVDRWMAQSPARHLVTFYGRLTPTAAWEQALGAWVGLSLLDSTPAFLAAVPTKIYEYAAAHLAVLTTPLPRPAELVSEHGFGRVVADPLSAAAALMGWAREPETLRAARVAAASWATGLDGSDDYAKFGAEIVTLSGSNSPRR